VKLLRPMRNGLRVRTIQPVAEWECEYSFHVCIMMPVLAAS
jgi:hypothetical protein